MEDTTAVVESQLDWLTVAVHSQERNLDLEHFADELMRTSEAGQNELGAFRLNGYVGWRCGRVRYGTRQGAGLVQLSGQLAEDHFGELYPWVDRISRLDLAVTVRTPHYDPELGERHYYCADQWVRRKPHAALPWYVGDARGGFTFYVGDRASDYFFRCYNKQAESRQDPEQARHYERCWRYELECKGGTAGLVARDIDTAGDRDRAWRVQGMVFDYCSRHGFAPAFAAEGGQRLTPGFRRRSDRETRLDWLAKSVAPAVRWLLDQGDRDAVLELLGLQEPPDLELDHTSPQVD